MVVLMFMSVVVFMRMLMIMGITMLVMGVSVGICHAASMGVFVGMPVCEMDIKLYTFDAGLLSATHMQMKVVQAQFAEFGLESVKIDSQIDQCANQHVAANSAEDIEIKCFHSSASALIWLAAYP